MVATTLPATVRVVDLPTGTTITGVELLEVVQTASGVGQSIQVPISQIMTTSLGGLPTGGGTGQLLVKTSATNFVTNFTSISSLVAVGTSLATTGSLTSIVAFIANQGITSTQIANNAIGTNQVASSLGIASTLSVGTNLTVAGTLNVGGISTFGGTATFSGGLVEAGTVGITGNTLITGTFGVVGSSLLTGTLSVLGTTFVTGTFGQVGTSLMTGLFGVVGTAAFTGVHNVNGTTLFTSGSFGVVGTALFTSGAFGVVGTSQFTGVFNITGTTIQTGSFVLASQATGVLVSSGTGVVSAQGGMVLLNTLSPNNVASTNDTTSFTAAYKNYMIFFDGVCPATQTTTFQMQVATTGAAFTTSGYVSIAQVNVSSVIVTDTSTSAIILTGTRSTTQMQTALTLGLSGFVKLIGAQNPIGEVRQMIGQCTFAATGGALSTTTFAIANLGGVYTGGFTISGVNFLFSSGNIQTGIVKIYGIT